MGSVKYIIAIAAGKGGVGKSTITVNLALALKYLGKTVGIIDADLYGPSVRHMLPEDKLPEQSSHDAQKIVPATAQGIKIISTAYFRVQNEASIIRAPIANAAIQQFLCSVEWGDLDYLLIDFPPGTGDIQLTLAQQAKITGALIVTMPSQLSLIDVHKAIQLFEQTAVPILGIVENMHDLFPGQAGETLSKEFGVPLLEKLPFEVAVSECGDLGKDLFLHYPESPTAAAFFRLAKSIEKEIEDFLVKDVNVFLKDSQLLHIEWCDGYSKEISAYELQRRCPCVHCQKNHRDINIDVQVQQVHKVGHYAIKVQFDQGCSRGIYPIAILRDY